MRAIFHPPTLKSFDGIPHEKQAISFLEVGFLQKRRLHLRHQPPAHVGLLCQLLHRPPLAGMREKSADDPAKLLGEGIDGLAYGRSIGPTRNVYEQPRCVDPAVAHAVEVADVLFPTPLCYTWRDVLIAVKEYTVRWIQLELVEEAQDCVRRKVLPSLHEQIDPPLVGFYRECDDLIPLNLSWVSTP